MRIYAFEQIDEWLDAIPLAAKRALESAGCKLSVVAWRRMRSGARVAIAALGAERRIELARVRDLLIEEGAPFEPMSPTQDPAHRAPPPELVRALKIDPSTWRALKPLDRWVLARFARRGRVERLRLAYEEMLADEPPHSIGPLSTHLDARGEVHMVDVGTKDVTLRHAIARAEVRMANETVLRLRSGDTPKGDVLATARVAAIQAAKRTPDIIPLCHAVALTKVTVDIAIVDGGAIVDVRAEARDRTGVEMEAMVGASAGALTLYDMLKGIDRGIRFEVALVEKAGGKSGTWNRTA
jgi:cyclic pyranopterin phosphate synthase